MKNQRWTAGKMEASQAREGWSYSAEHSQSIIKFSNTVLWQINQSTFGLQLKQSIAPTNQPNKFTIYYHN